MPSEPTAGVAKPAAKGDRDAEARKLELEVALLQRQLTPAHRRMEFLKNLAGATGIVIALATLAGGTLSIVEYLDGQQSARELRADERLDRALALLSAERPHQRAAAISSLRLSLTRSDAERNTLVLVSIANALPLEESRVVRNAMFGLVDELQPTASNKAALAAALRSLVQNNRNLVRDNPSVWRNPENVNNATKDGDALRVSARAIALILTKGVRHTDVSRLYLAEVDLRDADLRGANLSHTILYRANLSGARLAGASLRQAYLAGTRFVGADLRSADLRMHIAAANYVDLQVNRPGSRPVEVPSFMCADLEDANFTFHPLAVRYRTGDRDRSTALNFSRANLRGTEFRRALVYKVYTDEGAGASHVEPFGLDRLDYLEGPGFDKLPLQRVKYLIRPVGQLRQHEVNMLQDIFWLADWRKANLYRDIIGLLPPAFAFTSVPTCLRQVRESLEYNPPDPDKEGAFTVGDFELVQPPDD